MFVFFFEREGKTRHTLFVVQIFCIFKAPKV